MASNTNIGVALVLSARDQASTALNEFFNKTEAKMKAFGQGMAKIGEGIAQVYAAKKGIDTLNETVDAYGDVQEAQIKMKTTMMQKGGVFDAQTYNALNAYSEKISNTFTGTQASYTAMFQELMRNRIDPKLILGGMGEQVAKLGVVLDTAPATIANFTAHMINDAGVAVNKARDIMDMTARLADMGVGLTGPETVTAMTEFFGKASLGMKTLGWQGIAAAKSIGLIGAMFIATGLQAGTVGTNVRRIEDSLRDKGKMNLVSKMAASIRTLAHPHGVKLKFTDEKGNNLDPENTFKQFLKLKGESAAVIDAILKPFGGKQGLSTDFIEAIASGKMDLEKFKKQYEAKADFEEKYAEIMKGYNKQKNVFKSNVTNTMARIGKAIVPIFTKVLTILNRVTMAIAEFAKQYPKITKYIAVFIGITSAAMALMGVINIFKGIITIARVLNMTLAMNPFVAIAVVAAAAAYIIWDNWGSIKKFFINLWAQTKQIFNNFWAWIKLQWWFKFSIGLKNIFIKAWEGIKYVFLHYTPLGIIINHWKGIGAFFSALWDVVKAVFGLAWRFITWVFMKYTVFGLVIRKWSVISGFFRKVWGEVKQIFAVVWQDIKYLFLHYTPLGLVINHWKVMTAFFEMLWNDVKGVFVRMFNWVWGWGKRFFDAGANIINSIVEGIKSKVHHIEDVMHGVAKKIRDFMPFSPAKRGPLKDIHRIKLAETIAVSIKADSLVMKMRMLAQEMRDAFNRSMKEWMNGSMWDKLTMTAHARVVAEQVKAPVYQRYVRPIYTIPQFAGIGSGALVAPERFSSYKPLAHYAPDKEPGSFNGGRGPISFNLTVNLSGSATAADAKLLGDTMEDRFNKMMKGWQRNNERVKF